MSQPTVVLPAHEHREAIRLARQSRHFPFGTILIGTLMVGSLLPTILTLIAQSPINPIP